MDASQLLYPEILHSGLNTSFASCTCRRLVKSSEILTNIIWVQWTRMDASQLWFTEIVHSAPKYEFCTFYVSKVSEMLRNTPKHHFRSNGLNGCFTTLVPQNSPFRLEQKFCILFVPKVSEMFRNTPKHHFGSNGLEWILHNFGTSK
jgi:glycopeptide antibiotics resistance protein